MKKLFLGTLIIAMLLAATAVFAGGEQESGGSTAGEGSLTEQSMNLRFIGASPGGTYFIVLGGLSETVQKEVPNWSVTVEPGTSLSDVIRVAQGDGDLALAQHTAVLEAMNNEERKEAAQKVRSLGAIATSAAQFIIGKDVPIDSFDQFVAEKPKLRISFGPTTEVHWVGMERLLGEYGLTPDDVRDWGAKIYYKEMGEATDMYASGGLEGYFLIALTPTAPTTELAFDHELKMLTVKESVLDSLSEKYGYAKVTLPANTYDFIQKPIQTFAAKTITVVSSDMPEEVAYSIVKALLDNMDEFKSRHAILKNLNLEYLIDTNGVPLHDGAIRAYKEAGIEF